MTETAAEYKIDSDEGSRKIANCKKCNTPFGIEADGGKYLLPGLNVMFAGDIGFMNASLRIYNLTAECSICGEPIWWTSSERRLKRIIDKKKRRKDE